jgi:hypothetical protein
MDFISRKEIIAGLNHSLEPMLNKYNLDEIGVYEEEGEGKTYYMGYTIKKDNHVFMIHLPYEKNNEGELSVKDSTWTIQSENNEVRGIETLDQAVNQMNQLLH